MTTTDTFQKEIRYDRETRDFCATLDGNCIGYFASRHEAEVALDQVAYDLLMAGQTRTATELDGGSDADAPAEMTSDTAQAILDALNEAQRLQYTTSELQAHTTYEGVIASLRAELDAYGYTTKLSGRTGAWVPASAHGWRYVSGVRAHYTAPAVTQVNWSDRQHCRTCGSDKHPTSACPITTPPARSFVARIVGDLGF